MERKCLGTAEVMETWKLELRLSWKCWLLNKLIVCFLEHSGHVILGKNYGIQSVSFQTIFNIYKATRPKATRDCSFSMTQY